MPKSRALSTDKEYADIGYEVPVTDSVKKTPNWVNLAQLDGHLMIHWLIILYIRYVIQNEQGVVLLIILDVLIVPMNGLLLYNWQVSTYR